MPVRRDAARIPALVVVTAGAVTSSLGAGVMVRSRSSATARRGTFVASPLIGSKVATPDDPGMRPERGHLGSPSGDWARRRLWLWG